METPANRKVYVSPTLSEHGKIIARTEAHLINPPREDDLSYAMA
ncbi:MAG TPA: hypothetical protein VGG84_13530 [Gemmatimonadaceae bacterium]